MADEGGMTVADLVARLRADTGSFQSDMNQAQQSLGGMGESAKESDGLLSSLGDTVQEVAGGISLALVGAMVDFVSTGISMNATIETATNQFASLMGNTDQAVQHMQDLKDLASHSGIELTSWVAASKQMQLLGGDALDTVDNLKMVGDAAAASGKDVSQISTFVGRFYQALEGGQPITAAATRMQRMGIITADARNQLVQLQSEGASQAQIWQAFQDAMGKNAGAMDTMSRSWAGLRTTLHDNLDVAMADAFKPMFDSLKNLLGVMVDFTNSSTFAQWVDYVKTKMAGFATVVDDITTHIGHFLTQAQGISSVALNMGSGLSSITGAFQILAPAIAAVVGALAKAELGNIPFVGALTEMIPLPGPLIAGFLALALSSDKARAALGDLGEKAAILVGALTPIATTILADLAAAFKDLVAPAIKVVADAVGDVTPAIVGLARGIQAAVEFLLPIVTTVAKWILTLLDAKAVIYLLVAALVAWKAVELVTWIMSTISAVTSFVSSLSSAISTAQNLTGVFANLTKAAGSSGAAAGIGELGTSLAAVPIVGWVAAAVAVAGSIAFLGWSDAAARTHKEIDTLAHSLASLPGALATLQGMGENLANLGSAITGSMNKDNHGAGALFASLGFDDATMGGYFANIGDGFGKMAEKIKEDITGLGSSNQRTHTTMTQLAADIDAVRQSGSTAAPLLDNLMSMFNNKEIDAGTFQKLVSSLMTQATILPDATDKAIKLSDAQKKVKETTDNLAAANLSLGQSQLTAAGYATTLAGNWSQLWHVGEQLVQVSKDNTKAMGAWLDPTKALGDATSKLGKDGVASLGDWSKQMTATAKAAADFKANLEILAAHGDDQLVAAFSKDPEKFAPLAAQAVAAIAKVGGPMVDALNTTVGQALNQGSTIGSDIANQIWLDLYTATKKNNPADIAKALGLSPDALKKIISIGGADAGKLLVEVLAHAGTDAGTDAAKSLALALSISIDDIDDPAIKQKYIDAITAITGHPPVATVPINFVDDPAQIAAMVNNIGGILNFQPHVQATVSAATTAQMNVTAANVIVQTHLFGKSSANGNIFSAFASGGEMAAFAKGTENHVAQIAGAGTTRVWAEPETGGEAYIPLAMGKRGRSTAILKDVAHQFGLEVVSANTARYADGGVTRPVNAAPGHAPSSVTIEHHYHRQTSDVEMGRQTLWDVSRLGLAR